MGTGRLAPSAPPKPDMPSAAARSSEAPPGQYKPGPAPSQHGGPAPVPRSGLDGLSACQRPGRPADAEEPTAGGAAKPFVLLGLTRPGGLSSARQGRDAGAGATAAGGSPPKHRRGASAYLAPVLPSPCGSVRPRGNALIGAATSGSGGVRTGGDGSPGGTHLSGEDLRVLKQLSESVPASEAVTSSLLRKADALLQDDHDPPPPLPHMEAGGAAGLSSAEAALLSEALQG
mmetsp:Transcript_26570/g.78909  ORF Transcript_26570/g.78909 Transcript_26570/m.78909 type:complete len:231 (-) Transcript_26570:336-1028(-)